MNVFRILQLSVLTALLSACVGGKTPSSSDKFAKILPATALTIDQTSISLLLENSSAKVSGACESDLGGVTLTLGTTSLSAPCSNDSWQLDLIHNYFSTSDYSVSLSAQQFGQNVTAGVHHETLGYVCANASPSEITARNLTTGCNVITVNDLQSGSGVSLATAIASGCTNNCPTYDSATGNMTLGAGQSAVTLPSSPELTADEALTIYANFRWTGSGMNLGGVPAAMLLEKGQNDDDNYGIYFWSNSDQFCFEYNTFHVVYNSHCIVNAVTMNNNLSVAVVYSFASQNVKMYVNGILRGTFAQSKRLRNNNFPLVVGQQNYPGNEFQMYGTIRNVTVLNRSLTDAEIALMHSVTNP